MAGIRDSLKILYFLFSPFKKTLALYLLAVIILSGLEVLRISLAYPIINYGLGIDNQPKIFDIFYDYILPTSVNPFIGSAVLLVIITIIIAIFYSIVAYHGAFVIATVRVSLDRKVFEKITNHQYNYFARKKQGDLLFIGQGAVNESSNAITAFIDLIRNSLLALFYLGFLFYISFWLTAGLLLTGLIYAFIIKKQLLTRIYRNSLELTTASMEKSVIYQEFLSGVKTIFITDSVGTFKKRYESSVKKLLKTYTNVIALNKLPTIVNDFIMFFLISTGAILLYIFTDGNFISYIGIFGTIVLALYRLIPCVNSIQGYVASIVQYIPSLNLVYNELTTEDDTEKFDASRIEKKQKFSFEKRIEFRNVSFRYYGARTNTLENITFVIGKRQKIAIVGNSGSGKTTAANLLALLYRPNSGGIFIDNVNISDFVTAEYLNHLGYIGQETFIFHDTIRANILFGLERTEQEIIEAAKLADAHDFIVKTDNGYDTIIGDQGLKLSGGQRQRIAIARIILRNPDILLLDEATSSLDNISETKIIDSVQQLSEKMTVITIAHRLSTIQNSDVIYVMRQGQIVEVGRHEELLENNGEYYQLYIGQQKEDTGDVL